MCQSCTQKAIELEAKIEKLKTECMKEAGTVLSAYSEMGQLSAEAAIALEFGAIPEGAPEDIIVTAVVQAAHILHEGDNALQSLYTKAMELGALRVTQEGLYFAGDSFAEEFPGGPTKPPTVH